MKIGLSSAAYYGQLETDEAAAHIAELPLDTCEVFLETPSEYTTDFTFRMRYNMNNFPVTSVHPLGTQFEPQLFGRAARQSDDAFAMFANVCRAAESLGAAYYIFHGPFGVRGHLSPANIPFLASRHICQQDPHAGFGRTQSERIQLECRRPYGHEPGSHR